MSNRLAKRVVARRWARECYEAVEDKAAFAQCVAELAAPPEPPKPDPLQPMTDAEARAFSATIVRDWKYKGQPVSAVPLAYAEALAYPTRRQREFLRDLRRYLESPAIKRLREQDDDE